VGKKITSATKLKNNKSTQVISFASDLIGRPYKYGGNDKKGFDCSGFTKHVFDQVNVDIPRTSLDQSKVGKLVKVEQAKQGDLIFFRKGKTGKKINHVGIVESAAPNKLIVIHSTSSKGVLKENIYNSSYWRSRILYCRRVLR